MGPIQTLCCPRDGTALVRGHATRSDAFTDHGMLHCPTCTGILLNAEAATNSITEEKLKKMHQAFQTDCEKTDLDCPCCDSKMRVRQIVFKRINGTDLEPIELDGCPECNTFWFDSGELQRVVSPDDEPYEESDREANALLMALELLILLPYKFV
ncbi:MAG TPA: hypothetical protein D7H80_03735 [Candidatus Poseidoniales archaeon]|nr:MAG TPA: hypothetical protein D7H80_03735 [Candidatus Poseidoniales archaeon]HII26337.1 hypothetical protein [Candidatus Thalassarchaeaceae archaeon]